MQISNAIRIAQYSKHCQKCYRYSYARISNVKICNRIFNHRFYSQQSSQSQSMDDKTLILKTHYKTLGVPLNASVDDVKKAYNGLIKQWHPDLYATKPISEQRMAQQKFRDIRTAYEYLLNPPIDLSDTQHTTDDTSTKQTKRSTPFSGGKSGTYYSWFDPKSHSQQQPQSHTSDGGFGFTAAQRQQFTKHSLLGNLMYGWYHRYMKIILESNPPWMNIYITLFMGYILLRFFYAVRYQQISVFKVRNTLPTNGDDDDDDKNRFVNFVPSIASAPQTLPMYVRLQSYFRQSPKRGDLKSRIQSKQSKQSKTNELSDNSVSNDKSDDTTVDISEPKSEIKQSNIDSEKSTAANTDTGTDTDATTKKHRMKPKASVKYDEIPSELTATPMASLLASYAVQTGSVAKNDESGEFDWTPVLDAYEKEIESQSQPSAM